MKIIVKKGAPSLVKFMNRGGKFKAYRHDFTNYDFCWKKLGNDQEAYTAMVAEFGAEMLALLSNPAHKAEVAKWMVGKGV
jgi:hypothetical protein